MKNILCFVFVFCYLKSAAQKVDTTFYSVVNLSKIIGENKIWKSSENEYHYYYYFNDRGRGQVVNATVNTNLTHKVIKVQADGLDYFKSPFTASFVAINDSLIITNNGDRKAELDSGQYYVFSSVPAGADIFLKALYEAPKNCLLIMGGDSAFISSTEPFLFTIKNNKIKLLLCTVNYGPGSAPAFTWLDENHNYFADVNGWTATIKKGYETLIDTLINLQEKEAVPFYKDIYNQLSDSLPTKLAIKNVLLFDAPNATTIPNTTVLIDNGIIIASGKTSDIKIPNDFTIIDGVGKTMLPGLWDTHGHYFKDEGIDYLSGGITHIRDMGNMPSIKQVQQNIRLHNLTGPDISYRSGFIDKDDEYHGPVGKLVNSEKEALDAVNYFHNEGYNQIKIYSSIDTSWVKPMCTQAHQLGMRVAGHIPVHMTAAKAVLDGYDEITHMNMVMLNFFPDTIDTRKNRMKPVGQLAYTIDLKSKSVQEFIHLLKQKHIVVEPTINLFNSMFNSFPGDTDPVYKPVINWMPAAWQQNTVVSSFIDDTMLISNYQKSFERMTEMLKLLYDNHITLLAGTDGGAQLALQHELELFVKAGIPANEVLKIATYNPTNIFGLDSLYGEIKKGRVADFILVDGNPTENISAIRNVFLVVTNKAMYYPKKLYKYSGWNYYY